jgi:hypothetical protein
MKLNSLTLKKLILEVMEEATRRDFLKGMVGLGATAALGGKISDLNVGEDETDFGPFKPVSPASMGVAKKSATLTPSMKEAGKEALDSLRSTPDVEFYTVAPAQDPTFGGSYAYVDMNSIYDEADKSIDLDIAVEDAELFYEDWTVMQVYKYVFGQLAFWGTFRDESNAQSRKMTKTVSTTDSLGQEVKVKLLPLAWTVSLDIFMQKMLLLDSKLQQYPNNRKEILMQEGMTEEEYKIVKEKYDDLLKTLNNPAYIPNPDYEPQENQ